MVYIEDLWSIEELRSSHVSGLMTLNILLSQVEDLRSSPLSGLMTFEKRKSVRASSAASLMRCGILMTCDMLILQVV